MRNKLIAAAAGLFGYGALWGWALTADHYEQKLKGLEGRVDDLESLNDFLRKRPLGQITNIYNDSMGVHGEGQFIDPEQEELPFEGASDEEIVQEEDGTLRTRTIQKGRITGVSVDEQPNAWGETIKVVDVQDSEAENSPEENSDEDSEGEPDEDPETTRSNLQRLIDQYTANPDDVDTFVNHAGRSSSVDHTPPFVISQAQYSWDEDEGDDYAKITVTYYPRNRIVLDDDEEPMDDVGNILGWRNLAQFGGESGDPDVVFIRNRRMMTDFEVVRDEESELPLHVKYGMGKEEFQVNKAAGTLRLRDEDL